MHKSACKKKVNTCEEIIPCRPLKTQMLVKGKLRGVEKKKDHYDISAYVRSRNMPKRPALRPICQDSRKSLRKGEVNPKGGWGCVIAGGG